METSARAQRERDLAVYYDSEVRERAGRELPAERVARREEFLGLLVAEGRGSVLEIGAGPGRDGSAFAAAGLAYTGVDLAPASIAACRGIGLDVQVASVFDLPFPDAAFEAGWTMSTLLHVAEADLDAALAEVVRVLRPGAPLAVGLWGGEEIGEGPHGDTEHGPARFFSFRSDARVRDALDRHGALEWWGTWPGSRSLHYQFGLVRTPV
ncbi:class I SAM-dependent methyltransferase [Pseudonocardia sp. MH-G8]|uniref:class I SAM-dependent methyltransferase n=1 Tax=Pseudonocardia sp. MH-G8 TaxID=1854588 RepID=UPI0018E977FD|nr:class I SAM-dependent methyltransferase [Pseudonocardia sp. MH-G8]